MSLLRGLVRELMRLLARSQSSQVIMPPDYYCHWCGKVHAPMEKACQECELSE